MDVYDPQQHTLLTVLSDLAQRTPDAAFLAASADVSLSYQETYLLSTQLVPRRLIDICPTLKLKANPRVVIISPNSVLVTLAFWALWSISATVVPLSTSADPSLWASMMDVAKPDLILIAESLKPKLLDKGIPVVGLDTLIPGMPSTSSQVSQKGIVLCKAWLSQDSKSSSDNATTTHPSTPATLLFTSSAIDAATLKSVTYTHAALLVASWKSIEGLGGAEYARVPKRHLGWLPLSHCYELTFCWLGIVLRSGGTYVFHDPSISTPDAPSGMPLPHLLLSSLEFHQPITSFCVVPAILSGVYQDLTPAQLQCLRSLSSLCAGGAASPPALAEWAVDQGINYADMIGATEMVGLLATRKFWVKRGGFELAYGMMGILEKEDESDTFGELIIKGKHFPSSYDFKSSDAFHYDSETGVTTYRTQDLYNCGPNFVGQTILAGQPLPEFDPMSPVMSDIFYMGRMDDMLVLSSGIKVDAVALERSLDAQPQISRSAVILSPRKDALIALLVPKSELVHDTIIHAVMAINSGLTYEKRIQRDNVILVDALPVTTKLTIHRKQLKRIVADAGGEWPQHRRLALPNPLSLPSTPSSFSPSLPSSAASSVPPSPTTPLTPISGLQVSIPIHIRRRMEEIIADTFSIDLDEVQDPRFCMSDLPITSLASVRLAGKIQAAFDCQLKQAQLYSARGVADLCQYVLDSQASSVPVKTARTLAPIQTRVPQMPPMPTPALDHIVISGVACRYPGGIASLDDFWATLITPEPHASSIARPAHVSRWDANKEKAALPMAWLDDNVIDNVSAVASFFRLPPAEVEAMPPNIRLVMQMGYSALEDAGVAPSSLSGKSWGVFTCMNDSGWRETRVQKLPMQNYARFMTSLVDDSAGARLSYYLDLTGPAVEVKTACSSSAVAIHQACSAIRNGDCDAAIVIAAATHFSPAGAIFREQAGIGSLSGRCATFSANADGFLPSEGAVAVVIQREADTTSPAYGRIRASAIGQDGRGQNFASPNMNAQARVIETALKKAGCGPDDISYLEAHGTGTPVGDSIEIAAINRVYGGKRTRPLFVGAAKAVFGHTEECAGLTGVLKALQCFENNVLPPQPHLTTVNEELDLYASKIIIPRSVQAFSQRNGPRLIGVSSFGLSGTLAHLILEEPTLPPPVFEADQPGLFLLSATSSNDLTSSIRQFLKYTGTVRCQQTSLADVCRTTQIGRDHFAYRKAWPVRSWKDLVHRLSSTLKDEPTRNRTARNPAISLWFGLPHAAKKHSRNSTLNHPVYWDTLADCKARGCTPALEVFAKQLAVACTLEAVGCRVSAVSGDGVGEYVAACFAGVINRVTLFSLLTSLLSDSRVAQTQPWIVRCPRHELEDHVLAFGPQEIRIVASYGPEATCVAGSSAAIEELQKLIGLQAFSPAHPFLSLTLPTAKRLDLAPPRMAVVSSRLGETMDAAMLGSAEYWASVPEQPVSAQDACGALAAMGELVVDINTSGVGVDIVLPGKAEVVLGFDAGVDAVLGRLFEAGCSLDWKALASEGPTAHLPAYPWSRDRDVC